MASFEKDLFISYAHIDNEPLTPGEQGWITRFHAALASLLSMRLGNEARIWRDDKLQGNDIFADEIVDQFSKTALLVSVMTPRYLNSEWCTREVEEFCRSAEQSGGVLVGNKARVFKVMKTPVGEQQSLPTVLEKALGYEFYTGEEGAEEEFNPEFGQEYKEGFYRRIGKLAVDLCQLLEKLETGAADATDEPSATARPVVYLAECSYDRKEAREKLKDDLQSHGCTVLPDQEVPREEAGYVEAVQGMLERCALSIHLVGESYGLVPDGPSQKSAVILQNELSVQRARDGSLERVVWLPDGTRSEKAEQQQFIDAMHGDAEVQFEAEMITADLETLKTAIHASLEKLSRPEPRSADAPGDGARRIYLVFDERDRKSSLPLRKFLREQGFEIDTPVFEGNAGQVRAANQQCMANCDAVMIFYAAGDEAWKHTVDNELKKMPGYRDGKPLLANYTYLAAPKTAHKEDLIDMEEPDLIDGIDDFSAAALDAFVQSVSATDKDQ